MEPLLVLFISKGLMDVDLIVASVIQSDKFLILLD
jgi:hypothetical protein